MKKVSISLLIVLPFILIYAISLLGKLYSNVAHVFAEYVALFINDVRQDNGIVLNYDIDDNGYDPIPLDIRVMPELAKDREYFVDNSNPKASKIEVDKTTMAASLYLLDKGTSKYTIRSHERPSLEYTFTVEVEFGKIRGIEFFDHDDKSHNITDLYLSLGRKKTINLEYFPSTTRQIYKDVTWTFMCGDFTLDELGVFAPLYPEVIESNTSSINVTGLLPGDVVATATCKELPEVSASLNIHVVDTDTTSRAYFNFFPSGGGSLKVYSNSFDFKSEGGDEEGKILFNDPNLTYSDVVIKCSSDKVNQDRLNELVLEYIGEYNPKTHASQVITVDLYVKDKTEKIGPLLDTIAIQFRE